MLNSERKTRSRAGNNFYVPPPARKQEGADSYVLCDNKAKDRVLEAKLKNAAEETKICNNSSLLFKAEEETSRQTSATESSKKKRRRKKKSIPHENKTDGNNEQLESSVHLNSNEDILFDGNDMTQFNNLEEARGSVSNESVDSVNDSVLFPTDKEATSESNVSTNASDLNCHSKSKYSVPSEPYCDNNMYFDSEDQMKNCVEEKISSVQKNNSTNETDKKENSDKSFSDSNKSLSSNVHEEKCSVKKKSEPDTKKSNNQKLCLNKADVVEPSEKEAISRSVEICENNNICAIFRSSDVHSKPSTNKTEVASDNVEEQEDDYEWEKLLDEDFKNLRVTTTFKNTPTEESTKTTSSKAPWETESNDSSVIEIYGFPEEFKTQDILMAFTAFINRGFKLKWVDNTHALGIFPSPSIADEALNSALPFVSTRPLNQATTLSKEKAKHIIFPTALRPKTCSALARRLVSGALGVKAVFTQAEREAEREILKQAREQKRLAAKQREAAWEGRF